jgi:hypothetical protein
VGMTVMTLGLTPLVRAWHAPTAPLPVERHLLKEARPHTIDNRQLQMPGPTPCQIDVHPCLYSARDDKGRMADGAVGR